MTDVQDVFSRRGPEPVAVGFGDSSFTLKITDLVNVQTGRHRLLL